MYVVWLAFADNRLHQLLHEDHGKMLRDVPMRDRSANEYALLFLLLNFVNKRFALLRKQEK